MPLQPITPIFSIALNACNDTTATGMADLRTGAPYYAGLNGGDYFDLTEAQANQLSYSTNGTLHAGRYRRVQVDSGATASNVKTGTIGYMVAGGQPQLDLVTSYDKSIVGAHPVVYLNAITPGNWGFVQEIAGGVATVLCGSSLQKAAPNTGDMISSTTLGVAQDLTTQTLILNSLGVALDPPNPNTKIRIFCLGNLGNG